MELKDALDGLDHSNDDHWTAEGMPRVDVVSRLVGSDVTRAQISDAAPDLVRDEGKEPETSDAPKGRVEEIQEELANCREMKAEIVAESKALLATQVEIDARENQLVAELNQINPPETLAEINKRMQDAHAAALEKNFNAGKKALELIGANSNAAIPASPLDAALKAQGNK